MNARLPSAEAARMIAKRGRPRGSVGPLGRWLQSQINQYKRQGASCVNTFRALSLVEGGNDDGFLISDETADSWLYELGVNIAGEHVTYGGFRKAWGRQKIF